MHGVHAVRTVLLLALFTVGVGSNAIAQQRPELGYVFPPGAAPGTSVEVKLGGYDFTPDTQFFVLDERIQLEILGPPSEQLHPGTPHWFGPKAINSNKSFSVPREVPARITIPADVSPGMIKWQAANANGASEVGKFIIGTGTPERLESDCPLASNCRIVPKLPAVISGCLEKKEEIDCYEWTASEAGLFSCVLPACPVGSPLYPVLEIRDREGNRITEATATTQREVALTIPVQAKQTYRIRLHDADFRGDRSMVYRLHLHAGPHVSTTVPVAGERGQTQTVRFYGVGIQTGSSKLESIEQTVSFPKNSDSDFWHPPIDTPVGKTQPIRFELTELPEDIETQPSKRQPRPIPSAITGQLMNSHEVDEYQFHAEPEQRLWIVVEAERFGSPCDLALEVVDSTGKVVASNDDLPNRTDAGLMFQPKAADDFRVRVTDLSGTTSDRERCVYRLAISPMNVDFALSSPAFAETILGAEPVAAPNRTNPNARAKAGLLVVSIDRSRGFDGDVNLKLTDLPDGVRTGESTTITAKDSAVSLPIWCEADATSFAKFATVQATGQLADGTAIVQTVRVLVVPVMKPRAVVRPKYPDGGRTVYRGATYPAPVEVERLEDYTGEVELQMAARPDRVRQGIIAGDLTVPAGVDAIDFPLFIPEWVQTDRTSRIVLNTVVQVPDPQGNMRYLVNRMDRRITMNVEGALLKVSVDQPEIRWNPSDADDGLIDVPVRILRSPKLSGPVRMTLVDSPATGVQAEPVLIDEDQTEAILRVQTSSDSLTPGAYDLTVQTVGERSGLPVQSRADFVLSIRGDD